MDLGHVSDLHHSRLCWGDGVWWGNPRVEPVPHWLGWAAIIYSALGLIILAITRDALPIMHHLMPLVFGIILVLPS